LAFPDLSLPRRLLQFTRRGGRNTFGGTPHPRDEGGAIASHFWPFNHFFHGGFCQKIRRSVKKKDYKIR